MTPAWCATSGTGRSVEKKKSDFSTSSSCATEPVAEQSRVRDSLSSPRSPLRR
jgi:hypothetical protein